VPLTIEADLSAVPAIIDWYASRGLTSWLSVPDRLIRLPDVTTHLETVVMSRTLSSEESSATVTLGATPDAAWMRLYERDVPVDVLTAVADGEVMFASIAGAAVGRAAVTVAPDGTRWVGLSAVRVAKTQRRRGHARDLCARLLVWGADRGATRAYVQVLVDNSAAIAMYESMGLAVQHRSRYVDARTL
jgi:ribosomal protein S18 acetylase RimI-like enzyme